MTTLQKPKQINDGRKYCQCLTDYIDFTFTQDGSVGLFNKEVNDIYHSIFGAAEEAQEKFVKPLNFEKNYAQLKDIKILDICYGIGYNTKSIIKKIIQTKYKGTIKIDLLEYDKTLVFLSPFLKDSFFAKYPQISFTIIKSLCKYADNIDMRYSDKILSKKYSKKYFEPFYWSLASRFKSLTSFYTLLNNKQAFLHNIYYHCISQRNKTYLKRLSINDFTITPYFDDARKTIKRLNTQYNVIFLDAFTPTKLPTLWSLEFFQELYRLSAPDCLLVTYSNSASVRHAMLASGFSVGKIYDKNNRPCGTIASPDKNKIETPLNKYDLGLLQTRAGIYYRDKNLVLEQTKIIENWQLEKESSTLESSSQYIKKHKTEKFHEI